MPIAPPADPIAAVSHPHPYPYYAGLAARTPFYRDDRIGMWVASGAAEVHAVLSDPRCRVRPASEPVPRALLGSLTGDVFRRLVRMTDGVVHHRARRRAVAALHAFAAGDVAAHAGVVARRLIEEIRPDARAGLAEFAERMAVETMASLLGVRGDALPRTPGWVRDFGRSFAAGAELAAVYEGDAAVRALCAALDAAPARDADVVANDIGFLWQSYDATNGLIGNTLAALARSPDLRAEVRADSAVIARVVASTLRDDPPIQNTRRFVAEDTAIAGHALRAGDVVLIVIAAANRDPAAAASLTFGDGPHACPGETIAVAIAQCGVEALLATGLDPADLADPVSYRASANARIPQFGARARAGSPSGSPKDAA